MSNNITTAPRITVRGLALVGLLGAAMVTSTLLQGALGVLSSFIIDEFGITRSLFGLAFAVYSLVGGFASLYMGALADRNSRRVMVGLFALAGIGLLGAAVAPTYGMLLVAMLVGGLALGAGNPVTNRIVAEQVSLARRGPVIGVKQAGPPMGVFLAGIALPSLAVAFNWRVALGLVVLLPIVGLMSTFFLVPASSSASHPAGKVSELAGHVRFVVRWLTLIGFGVALANAGLLAFLPLFAQEEVALSATTAGLIAATMGLAGVVGRIMWGSLGGRFERPSSALLIIAAFSVLSFVSVAVSGALGIGWLWVGAIGSGLSVLAWHAVAWLVIVDRVDVGAVGKASGIMHMASTLGFAAGAPLTGLMLDLSGSYALTWGVLAAVMALVTGATAWFRARATVRRRAAAQ